MTLRSLSILLLVLTIGCAKPTSAPPAPGGGSPAVTLETPPKADPRPEAGLFAKDFVSALHDGKATAAQLTPTFKKAIAEPVFDADRAIGYSDSVAENWLKQFQGKIGGYSLSSPRVDTQVLYTGSIRSEKPMQILLRLVRDGNRWLVDWFSLAELSHHDSPGSLTAQSFAATAFLHGWLGHRYDLAAGAMTPGLKKSLAPALGSESRAFNTGILKIKLDGYRGPATGYTIAKAESGSVTGELIHANGRKAFALKVVAGERPDEWLVDAIKID